jgi:hypothetical protein
MLNDNLKDAHDAFIRIIGDSPTKDQEAKEILSRLEVGQEKFVLEASERGWVEIY